MKFMMFVLPTVPGTLEERQHLRPIGRNNERYQQMLNELRQLVVLAEEAGFDVFATTEHHFHSEGYEDRSHPCCSIQTWRPARSASSLPRSGWCSQRGIRSGWQRKLPSWII